MRPSRRPPPRAMLRPSWPRSAGGSTSWRAWSRAATPRAKTDGAAPHRLRLQPIQRRGSRCPRARARVVPGARGRGLGRVGFMAKVETDGLEHALDQVAAGDYGIEERFRIEAAILGPDGNVVDRH